jgi:hypothetical protein
MRQVYSIIQNALVFFLVTEIFVGVMVVGNGSFSDKFLTAIIYGSFITIIPNLLKFMKLNVNSGSLILAGLLVALLFYILGFYLLGFLNFTGNTIDLGTSVISTIKVADKTIGMIYLSVISAIASVGMDILRRNS